MILSGIFINLVSSGLVKVFESFTKETFESCMSEALNIAEKSFRKKYPSICISDSFLARQENVMILCNWIQEGNVSKMHPLLNKQNYTDSYATDEQVDFFINELQKAIENCPILIQRISYKMLSQTVETIDKMAKKMNVNDDSSISVKDISFANVKKYSDKFENYMFLEDRFDNKIKLRDVYIDSEIITNNVKYNKFIDFLKQLQTQTQMVVISGLPGVGKSTLTIYLAYLYIKESIFSGKNLFIIEGRRIKNSKLEPIDEIIEIVNLKSKLQLTNSVIILDAYDEIPKTAESEELNEKYFNDLLYSLKEIDGCQLFITVRPNYIKNDPRVVFVKLKGFDLQHRKKWLKQYKKFRSIDKQIENNLININLPNNMNEILEIPLMLYMIIVGNIDILKYQDKGNLYDQVFSEYGALNLRGNDDKEVANKNWKQNHILVLEIAHFMFKRNKLTIDDTEMNITIRERIQNNHAMVKNRFFVENYVKKDGYEYAFIHRSIFEYFTAEKICMDLKVFLEKHLNNIQEMNIVEINEELSEIFNTDIFDRYIYLYIKYRIENNYFSFLKSKKDYLDKFELFFYSLLESPLSTKATKNFTIHYKNMFLWIFNIFNSIFIFYHMESNKKLNFEGNNTFPHIISLLKGEYFYGNSLNLRRMNLRGVNLRRASLNLSILNDVHLDNAYLLGAELKNAYLIKSYLRSAELIEVDLTHTDLSHADLTNAKLMNATIHHTILEHAILCHAKMHGADFYDTKLQNANLYNAKLINTVINKVDISRANLKYSDMSGAAISNVLLTGAKIKGIKFLAPPWNEIKNYKIHSSIRYTTLYNADLRGILGVDNDTLDALIRVAIWTKTVHYGNLNIRVDKSIYNHLKAFLNYPLGRGDFILEDS